MSPVLALPGTGEILLHVVLFTLVLTNFLQVSALEWFFFLPKPRNLALRFYVANYAKTGTVRS